MKLYELMHQLHLMKEMYGDDIEVKRMDTSGMDGSPDVEDVEIVCHSDDDWRGKEYFGYMKLPYIIII